MKKLILFSLLVILGFHSLGQIPAYVPTSGLVAWYPFNGNANDESGNGNNLISFGSPAYVMDAFGNSYAASHFPNGNDHLETPSSSWALINNFQQGTVAFWLKIDSSYISGHYFGIGNSFIVKQKHGVGEDLFFGMQDGTTKIRMQISGIFPSQSGTDVIGSTSLNPNNWYHVVGVWNGVQHLLYINGVIDGQINNSNGMSNRPLPDYLSIGSILYGGNGTTTYPSGAYGSMDDIGIWNRALTASEIQTIYYFSTTTVNTITNQTYCNLQTVAPVPLSGTPSGVVFDITGGSSRGLPNQTNVSAIPAFTALTGSSVITVTPKYNGISGTPTTYTLTVNNCPAINLNLKFYIQGYYEGAGLMRPVMYNQGESTNPNTLQTDQVIVELHAATSPYTTIKTTIATLNKNGTLTCSFNGSVTNTPYYIVIHHRNSIVTWSAAPVMMIPNATYDFSNAPSKAYGNNMIEVEPNIWAMYNGDLNQDDAIDANDYLLLDIDIQGFASGYYASDINGDGTVDSNDYLLLDANIQGFITSSTP